MGWSAGRHLLLLAVVPVVADRGGIHRRKRGEIVNELFGQDLECFVGSGCGNGVHREQRDRQDCELSFHGGSPVFRLVGREHIMVVAIRQL